MVIVNKNIVKLAFAIVLIFTQILFAQRIKAPVNVQLKIIPKILSLNKSFSFADTKQYLNTSILFSPSQRNSMQVFKSFSKRINEKGLNVLNRQTNLHPIDITIVKNLKNYLRTNNIKVLYITPLRGVDINEITRICKEEKVLTITGVEEYRNNQVSVILGLEDNRMQIIINQKSAKQEGANFSSRLLKIATIIE